MNKNINVLALGALSLVGIFGYSEVVAAACVASLSSDTSKNSGLGTNTLCSLSSGSDNVGSGYGVLHYNSTGYRNSAVGNFTLNANTSGYENSAFGYNALVSNSNGHDNTAVGSYALNSNTTGFDNTAYGVGSLSSNTSGYDNVALGNRSLVNNSTGTYNTAIGHNAIDSNTTGSYNTASGSAALVYNTTGSGNTAIGNAALLNNSTGSNNISLGNGSGVNLTTGSNNIDIGNNGVAAESNTIRIGSQGTQTKAFMAGVRGATVTDSLAVLVNINGQLGVASSSRRYKEDIQPMGDVSDRLMNLQPVTFRYKQADQAGNKPIQYGLIAEDVDTVMPELVARNSDGSPESVAYHVLPSLLLNEYQKQHEKLADTETKLTATAADLAEAKYQITNIQAEMERMKQTMERFMAALPQATRVASVQ